MPSPSPRSMLLLVLALAAPSLAATQASQCDTQALAAIEVMKAQVGMQPSMTGVRNPQYQIRPGASRNFTFLPSQNMTLNMRFEVTWSTDFLGGGGMNPVDLVVRVRDASGQTKAAKRGRSPLRLDYRIERQSDGQRWRIEVQNPNNPIPGIENLRITLGAASP